MAEAIFDRWREWLTLQEAERVARAVPEEARAAARRALRVALQEREAATELWPRGSAVEALKLARAALEHAAEGIETFGATAGEGVAWVSKARAIAQGAREQTSGRATPALESEVGVAEEETYETLSTALTAIESAVGAYLDPPDEIARRRRARIGGAIAGVSITLMLLAWLLHVPAFTHAAATAARPDMAAELAIDGDPKTAWSVPDRQTGSLELTAGRVRSIRALRVLPHTSPSSDRGAKDVHVDAFLGSELVRGVDFSFAPPPPPGAAPAWAVVPLDAPKCDRVRIEVKSYYGAAGALAEVAVD